MSPNGSMLKVKIIGLSTEPWGTPWLTLLCKEDSSFTSANWNVSDKYDFNYPNIYIAGTRGTKYIYIYIADTRSVM